MSESLKTVLINDSRIEDISGEIGFAVNSGPQQNTYQPQTANTASNNSHSWQINVPSENIVIDRRMLIDADVQFVLTITNVPVGQVAFAWGSTHSFAPYPLNSCYLTQNTLINNCGLSVSTQDIMAPLLRLNEQKIHTHYDGWTPSMVDDVYYSYSDAVGTNNNPLAAIGDNSYDNKIRGRGCHPLTSCVIDHKIAGVSTNASVISTALTDSWVITITAHFTEPLLFLSPFISNPCVSNEAGFLGINNISFNFTLDTTLRRVLRTSTPILPNVAATTPLTSTTYTTTFALGTAFSGSGFSNLRMLVNYLSVQPSQYAKISARNVLPLLQYDRYLPNGGTSAIEIPAGTDSQLVSSNIALNQIPDTILIFARKQISSQYWTDSDSFLKIRGVSINFNNVSGILSSASPQELWLLSQKAGSSQSWLEFNGFCNKSNANGGISTIPTTGSILVLNPVSNFNLPDYLSNSSLGSFNLQFQLDVTNQSHSPVKVELVVITITSGYITTHQGTTQSFSGVLNKEMVMSAKEGSAVPRLSQSDYERLVGGVRDNRGVMNMMKQFKKNRIDGKMSTGGVMSGGVMSGGMPSRLGKYIK